MVLCESMCHMYAAYYTTGRVMLNFHFMILVKPALLRPAFTPASSSGLRNFHPQACSGCLFIAGKLLQSFHAACIVELGDLLRGSSAWNRIPRPDGGDLHSLSFTFSGGGGFPLKATASDLCPISACHLSACRRKPQPLPPFRWILAWTMSRSS